MVSVSVNASRESTRTALPGWASHVVLGLIVATAAYLRFNDLGADSLWFDEAASWDQATAGGLTDVIAATATDNYPPLHNLILWATIGVLGDSEWALRLPSAVFGVLNVAAIYWVASLVAGRAAGLIAALLLALSAFPAWYSGEARMYALLALSATLFAGASLRLWTRSSAVNTILVGVAGLALLYSHPYGALTWLCIAGAGAVVCARSEPGGLRAWRWVALQLVLLAGFLPWAWVLYRRAEAISERGFWIAYPTPAFVFRQIENLLSGPYVLALVVAAAVAGLWFKPREGGVFGDPPALPPLPARIIAKNLLLPAWAFGPIVLGYLISVAVEPIFVARYLLGSLPAILILAAIGLSRLTTSIPAAAATMAVVAGVTWFAGSGPGPRDDWRGAVTLVAELYRPPICVLMPGTGGVRVLRYYLRTPVDCLIFGSGPQPVDPRRVPSDLVFVVAYSTGGRSVEAVGADLREALPPPVWQVNGSIPFRGIEVMSVSRNR